MDEEVKGVYGERGEVGRSKPSERRGKEGIGGSGGRPPSQSESESEWRRKARGGGAGARECDMESGAG
jgi:hypothetical protein